MALRKSWSASSSIRSSARCWCWAPAACSPSCCGTRATLLPPFTAAAVQAALSRLGIGRLLGGYRGKPPGGPARAGRTPCWPARATRRTMWIDLLELDLNPVIVRPAGLGRRGGRCADSSCRGASRCPKPVSAPESAPLATGAILEVTLDRPKANAIDLAASRAPERGLQRLSRRSGVARLHRHRRGRAILLARLGPQGRGGRRANPTRTGAAAASAASITRAISTSRSSPPSTASPAAAASRSCSAATSS